MASDVNVSIEVKSASLEDRSLIPLMRSCAIRLSYSHVLLLSCPYGSCAITLAAGATLIMLLEVEARFDARTYAPSSDRVMMPS